MQLLKSINRTGSSHNQIAIKSVTDDVLVLPGERYRLVLETSALNFELKSEAERDVIIDAYQNFLNSLGFPIQFLVKVREIDIDTLKTELKQRYETERILVYRRQLKLFGEFITGLVRSNKILSRNFYAVVPFDDREKKGFDFAREQLLARSEEVTKGLNRLGTFVRPLRALETLDLFYSFYNPLQAKQQPLGETALKLMQFAVTTNKS